MFSSNKVILLCNILDVSYRLYSDISVILPYFVNGDHA